MNGFGLDGKLFRGLTKAGDFIILAVITVVFCLPVVTIGASLTASILFRNKISTRRGKLCIQRFLEVVQDEFCTGTFVRDCTWSYRLSSFY